MNSLTIDTVALHIAQPKAEMLRYNIIRTGYVLNLYETDISFKPNGRRCKGKALGRKGVMALKIFVRTKNIDHITVMSVVSVSGFAF